ncbi:hypothetical protein [Agitococcus lubricus]|uniref:Uncharacterized protein n=1 Tax=Agitococcus lubricus TaxID=1077255 RepID=A0A2T5J242_9GAMM|nr:hypothetical protein [Agitococcus lubricus]PTQ90510.1 hypothetical protein C8N29_103265 [Agitococcus lubricus]
MDYAWDKKQAEYAQGIEIGKEIGKEEGKAEGIAIAAMGMHKAGLSVELIAKSLSLTESVVLALLKED